MPARRFRRPWVLTRRSLPSSARSSALSFPAEQSIGNTEFRSLPSQAALFDRVSSAILRASESPYSKPLADRRERPPRRDRAGCVDEAPAEFGPLESVQLQALF